MLTIISSTLVVDVQSKVFHLLPISLNGKGSASLPKNNWEPVAVLGIGSAAVALLVQVAKRHAQPLEQAWSCEPVKQTNCSHAELKTVFPIVAGIHNDCMFRRNYKACVTLLGS